MKTAWTHGPKAIRHLEAGLFQVRHHLNQNKKQSLLWTKTMWMTLAWCGKKISLISIEMRFGIHLTDSYFLNFPGFIILNITFTFCFNPSFQMFWAAGPSPLGKMHPHQGRHVHPWRDPKPWYMLKRAERFTILGSTWHQWNKLNHSSQNSHQFAWKKVSPGSNRKYELHNF